jgi:hypothetical protein
MAFAKTPLATARGVEKDSTIEQRRLIMSVAFLFMDKQSRH